MTTISRPVETVTVTFNLNGRQAALATSPMTSLRDALRDHLHLHAAKAGCGQGACGSCTVMLDGRATLSCLVPVGLVDGRDVTTLEGITPPGTIHPLQQAFFETFASQCGYCSPGMIMAAKALIDENPSPTRHEIAEALAGNLCRCTGYVAILDAVELAAERMRS